MNKDATVGQAGQDSPDENRRDTASVDCTIARVRPMEGKRVYAFIDIELVFSGIPLLIYGIQARHVPGGGTSIHLPTYRDTDGSWRAAIDLPQELKDSLADQILDHLIELGVARQKAPTAGDAEDA